MSGLSFHNIADPTANNSASNDDERLRLQMQRLAAAQEELLGKTPSNPPRLSARESEADVLRAENAALRQRLKALESKNSSSGSGRAAWAEQQKEYEILLEEKSDVIRELHQKLRDLKKQKGPAQPAVDPNEPVPERQELLAMKHELEEQRRQFEEDEQSMMSQMQQMEMSMSRERAEMARQRNELQRMKETLDHEIERALRDPNLQDRLQSLQRSQHDAGQSGEAGAGAAKKNNSTLLRRIFG